MLGRRLNEPRRRIRRTRASRDYEPIDFSAFLMHFRSAPFPSSCLSAGLTAPAFVARAMSRGDSTLHLQSTMHLRPAYRAARLLEARSRARDKLSRVNGGTDIRMRIEGKRNACRRMSEYERNSAKVDAKL